MMPSIPALTLATREVEIERLQARIRELEAALGIGDTAFVPPVAFALSSTERALLAVLMARDQADKTALFAALYDGRNEHAPEPKIIDVFVCKLRRKLTPFGVTIETLWGQGYRLAPAAKDLIRTIKAQEFSPPERVA